MTDATRKVTVDLGDRKYDILVGRGLIANAATHLKPLLRRQRVAIVTDEAGAKLHLPSLHKSLDAAGIRHSALVLPQGEGTKSFAELERLTEWLLGESIERGDLVIALGGGVIGAFIGLAFDGTVVPLAIGYAVSGFGALALVLIGERGRLFQAVNVPER